MKGLVDLRLEEVEDEREVGEEERGVVGRDLLSKERPERSTDKLKLGL
jgi:hypothetical protein